MRAADCTRSRLTHDPAHRSRVMRCGTTLLVVTIMFTLVACSESTRSSTASTIDRHAVRNVDRHAVDGSDHAPARAAAAGIGPRTAGRRPGLRRAGAARPVFVGGRAGGRGAPPASGLPRPRQASRVGRDRAPANPAVAPLRLRPQHRRAPTAHRDRSRAHRRTRCPRGASTRRRRPTSCSVTTAKRRRRPASVGTTWRRSTWSKPASAASPA